MSMDGILIISILCTLPIFIIIFHTSFPVLFFIILLIYELRLTILLAEEVFLVLCLRLLLRIVIPDLDVFSDKF